MAAIEIVRPSAFVALTRLIQPPQKASLVLISGGFRLEVREATI